MSVVLSCDMFVSYAICVIKMLATRTPPTFLSLLPWLVLYDLSPVDIQVLDVGILHSLHFFCRNYF